MNRKGYAGRNLVLQLSLLQIIIGIAIFDGLSRGKAVVDVLVVILLVLFAQAGLGTLVSNMGGQAVQRPFF